MPVINSNSIDWSLILVIAAITCIIICLLSFIVLKTTKAADNTKPLIKKTAKILEKKLSQGNIEWYIVETENGERMQLRNFNANKMIISAGDYGIVSYKGKTIISFDRIQK